MAYIDYAYYTGAYGGSAVSEGDFPRFAAEASAYLDRITLDRAADHAGDERLKMCCCALCDAIHQTADTGGLIKQSESVGSWSYTLNNGAADVTAAGMMYDCCRRWLPAEWLYRGVARE